MNVKIPYYYPPNMFCLATINYGMTQCKKLEYEVKEILIGKKEQKEVSAWAASGTLFEGMELMKETMSRWGIKLTLTAKKKELAFICSPNPKYV